MTAYGFAAKVMMLCLFSPLWTAIGVADAGSPRVAIIPLANYTNSLKAQERITNLLYAGLEKLGYDLVDKETLRSGMRARRLRMIGEVDSIGADQIAAETGAEILLTGSVDMYLEQDNPEVSIGLRAYNCKTYKVVWVDCLSTTGDDQAGLFGIGRVKDAESLAARAVAMLLKRMPVLSEQVITSRKKLSKNDVRLAQEGKVAVVRFDNSTDFANADAVVTDAMILELFRRGFDVVEPGELSQLRSRLGIDFQGAISDTALTVLRKEHSVVMVITGVVTKFFPNRGASIDAVPEIEMTIRTIDPIGGDIASSLSIERDGSATETIFGSGRVSATGEVARQALSENWEKLIAGWFGRRTAAAGNSNLDGVQNAKQ